MYGVANQELNWCGSFLCSRKQVVHVRGRESGEAMLRYGSRKAVLLDRCSANILQIADVALRVVFLLFLL